MADPVEVLRAKVKQMVANSLEQINLAIDSYCDVMLATRKSTTLPPPPKDKEEAESCVVDLSNSSNDFQYEDETPAMIPVEVEKSDEHDFYDYDDDAQFIDDEPESDAFDDEDDEDFDEEDHDVKKTKRSTRERRQPTRFTPTEIKRARTEDRDAEEDGIDLARGLTKVDCEQWTVLRNKPLAYQTSTPWFRRRWGDQFAAFRSALGNESHSNKLPREIWDAIAADPEPFNTRKERIKSLERCAFCGCQRECDTYFGYKDRWHYMGSCCAKLFVAWRDFQRALHESATMSLGDMDRLFEAVRDAHVKKASGKRKK